MVLLCCNATTRSNYINLESFRNQSINHSFWKKFPSYSLNHWHGIQNNLLLPIPLHQSHSLKQFLRNLMRRTFSGASKLNLLSRPVVSKMLWSALKFPCDSSTNMIEMQELWILPTPHDAKIISSSHGSNHHCQAPSFHKFLEASICTNSGIRFMIFPETNLCKGMSIMRRASIYNPGRKISIIVYNHVHLLLTTCEAKLTIFMHVVNHVSG